MFFQILMSTMSHEPPLLSRLPLPGFVLSQMLAYKLRQRRRSSVCNEEPCRLHGWRGWRGWRVDAWMKNLVRGITASHLQ